MCTLAPRAAAPGFGATTTTAFLGRQRGVRTAACHNAAGEEPTTTRRARASEASTAPARKRGRHDGGLEHVVVVDPAAAASSALRVRMDAELVALQGLVKRAKLLPTAEKKRVPVVSSAAAKTSQPPKAATEAALASQNLHAAAPPPANSKKQQCSVQQAAAAKNLNAPEVPNSKQRPAEATPAAKQKHPVQRAASAAKTTEAVPKKRRPEEEEKEFARAAERAAFRQMLLDMEKSAMPDETVYPEEMEALGIPVEFVVTRTWKQALKDYHAAKKLELAAVRICSMVVSAAKG